MANESGGFPDWNTWINDMNEDQKEYEQHRLLYSINEWLKNQDTRLESHSQCLVDLQTRVHRLEKDPERKARKNDRLVLMLKQYGIQAILGLFVAAYFLAKLWTP